MRWGKTDKDKWYEEQKNMQNLIGKYVPVFLWLPIRSITGEWGWLRWAWKDHKVCYFDSGEYYDTYGKPDIYLDKPAKGEK